MITEIVNQSQFDFGRPRLVEDVPIPDRLKTGDSAVAVFCEIVRINPMIEAFSVKFYPQATKSDDSDIEHEGESKFSQPKMWLPRSCASEEMLRNISDISFRKSREENILGICSEVSLKSNETMHIPMIDFAVEDTEAARLFVASMVSSSKGALLSTGNSFHFWGTKLMARGEWYQTMQNYSNSESRRKDKPLFEKNFLKISLKRSYAALRIFGYPGTVHETEPKVVGVIK